MNRKTINLAATGHRHTRPVNRAQSERVRDWYRITNAADGSTATISIYDEIGFWGTSAAGFIDELRTLDVASLDVHINTPGGDVYDGVAIYNALLQHPADVTTRVDGMAASIGSVIAQAGDVRIMARASQMMIHEASALCVGNASDMRECAGMLDKVSDMIADVYAARAGGSGEVWRSAMAAETWYSSDEAVTAGLADAIQGQAATENTWDLSVFNYAGRTDAPAPALFTWDPDQFRAGVAAGIRSTTKEGK